MAITNAVKEEGQWVPPMFKPKEKPLVYIPTSDHTAEERDKLRKVMGVIYPVMALPQDIIGDLKTISMRFSAHNWSMLDWGRYYLTKFPDPEGLDHVISRTSILCPVYMARFKAYRWSGEKDDKIQIFLAKVWISIKGLSLHHRNRVDINKLTVKFTHLANVDEDTLSKIDIQEVKPMIDCDNLDSIPKEFNTVTDNQLWTKILTLRDPILNQGKLEKWEEMDRHYQRIGSYRSSVGEREID